MCSSHVWTVVDAVKLLLTGLGSLEGLMCVVSDKLLLSWLFGESELCEDLLVKLLFK